MSNLQVVEGIITFFLIIIFYTITGVSVHELGHSRAIHKYSKEKTIVLIGFFKHIPLFKGERLQIHLQPMSQTGQLGVCYSETNFTGFTEKQIKKIAKAGMKWEYRYGILLLFLYLQLSGQAIGVKLYVSFIYLFSMFALHCIANKGDGIERWGDKDIIKNPKGFCLYMDKEERQQENRKIFLEYYY